MEKEGQDILETDFNPIYDNLTECVLEIEELKNELTTIVMSQTSTGAGARDNGIPQKSNFKMAKKEG